MKKEHAAILLMACIIGVFFAAAGAREAANASRSASTDLYYDAIRFGCFALGIACVVGFAYAAAIIARK